MGRAQAEWQPPVFANRTDMTLKGCKFAAGGGADPASPWRKGYEGGSWCGRWVQWEDQARGSDPAAHMEKADDCYSSGCSRRVL